MRAGSGEGEIKECDGTFATGDGWSGCSAARSADETDNGRVGAAALRGLAAMSLAVGGWPGKLARGCYSVCTGALIRRFGL